MRPVPAAQAGRAGALTVLQSFAEKIFVSVPVH
jgi:hypothetical protein